MRVRYVRRFINNGAQRTAADHFGEAEATTEACNDAMHMHLFVQGTPKLPFGEGRPHRGLDVR
jgi:hypothetical protein